MDMQATGNTIIGFTARPATVRLKSLLSDEMQGLDTREEGAHTTYLKIRAASSPGQRSSASVLVNRMYATRGYLGTGLPAQAQLLHQMTLTTSEREQVVGTLTVGFDNPRGLFVDDLFQPEVDALRAAGRRVCEFTKLAVDREVKARSKRALASMFHVAYIYAFRIHGYTDLVIEVNPRHVPYYQRILGFRVLGEERLNRRVNAPAWLLGLDFSYAQRRIGELGGLNGHGTVGHERSLYGYAFSAREEAAIMERLRGTQAHT